MKRILVIGPGGAGKTIFSKRLGEILGLEVVHLDALYWKPGWTKPDESEWMAVLEAALGRDAWVMDGNYSGTLERRIEACDAVCFLDLPRLPCIWRVLARVARFRNRTRPDMAEGCPEHLSLGYLLWVWNFPRRAKPKILRLLDAHRHDREIIRLRSSEEAGQFLARLEQDRLQARRA
jgi:adenylate kinase family enzyme